MTIKRNEVYTVELTGEQLAWILLLTGETNGGWDQKSQLFEKVREMFEDTPGLGVLDLNDLNSRESKAEINRWLGKLFNPKESAELEELRKQYLSLGEKIKKLEEMLHE